MTTEQRADMIDFLNSYKERRICLVLPRHAWARHRPRGSSTPTHTRGQACQTEAEKIKARVESENEKRSHEAVPSRVLSSVYISGMARKHRPGPKEGWQSANVRRLQEPKQGKPNKQRIERR